MQNLLQDIKQCSICKDHLPLGPRPVVSAHPDSKIVIIGQAPGTKVHASGIPWDDASGNQLRKWLNVSSETFYNPKNFAIIPMVFAIPAKGSLAIYHHDQNALHNGTNPYLMNLKMLSWYF